jgi:hypothetical protein
MRFLSELGLIQEKNPSMPLHKLLRFLFHASQAIDLKEIAMSEPGLDIRYN